MELARMLLSRGAIIDPQTHRHLRLHAPMRYYTDYTAGTVGNRDLVLAPSNAQPLRRLVHKYYSIIVRLYVIGTPTSRPGPDRRRLAARSAAPLIAAFLVPESVPGAAEIWAESENLSMTDVYESEDEKDEKGFDVTPYGHVKVHKFNDESDESLEED